MAKLKLLVRDCYWHGSKLKRGPLGKRTILVDTSAPLAAALSAGAFAFGLPANCPVEFLSYVPGAGKPPTKLTNAAELASLPPANDVQFDDVVGIVWLQVGAGVRMDAPDAWTPRKGGDAGLDVASPRMFPVESPRSPRGLASARPSVDVTAETFTPRAFWGREQHQGLLAGGSPAVRPVPAPSGGAPWPGLLAGLPLPRLRLPSISYEAKIPTDGTVSPPNAKAGEKADLATQVAVLNHSMRRMEAGLQRARLFGITALLLIAALAGLALGVYVWVGTKPAGGGGTAIANGSAGTSGAAPAVSGSSSSTQTYWPEVYNAAAMTGVIRQYYVAIEDALWDFAPDTACCVDPANAAYLSSPSGCRCDLMMGGPIDPQYQTLWNMTRYVEYTDNSFTKQVTQPAWLGILGPIFRAEVGDTITVNVINRATTKLGPDGLDGPQFSMHPHGVRYSPGTCGALYNYQYGNCAAILPGGTCTYVWEAIPESGPVVGFDSYQSSKAWWYHSHVREPADSMKGLIGAIIIVAKGMANPDGTPKDVDAGHEFVTVFFIMAQDPQGSEVGNMHSVSGRTFGNLQGINMKFGAHVRWHFMAMGNEADIHTAHFHGKTLRVNGDSTDVIQLTSAAMSSGSFIADNAGVWMLHCHVADHIYAGMYTTYSILNADQSVDPITPNAVSSKLFWKDSALRKLRHAASGSGPTMAQSQVGDSTISPPPPPPSPPPPPAPPTPPPFPPGLGWL